MILVDWQLRELADTLGIDPQLVNPASVDLTLGGEIYEYRPQRRWRAALALFAQGRFASDVPPLGSPRVHHLAPGEAFLFRTGHFYLAHTAETITLPTTLAGNLVLKSTTGRRALEHLTAGYVDPGFHGQLTLELFPLKPVTVHVGERLVQLVLHRLAAEPARPYQSTGRYQGQTGVTPPRI